MDFSLIEGTQITKLSHLRKKKNDPLKHLCRLKVNSVISSLVRLFKVKNLKIFVLASALSQCYKHHRIESANHIWLLG